MQQFDAKVKAVVRQRDKGVCQWSGQHLADDAGDVHHRRPRGAGGSAAAWINEASNLVLVSRESHTYIETHPEEARERGFRLNPGQHPACTPIVDFVGESWLLQPDGSVTRG